MKAGNIGSRMLQMLVQMSARTVHRGPPQLSAALQTLLQKVRHLSFSCVLLTAVVRETNRDAPFQQTTPDKSPGPAPEGVRLVARPSKHIFKAS